LTYALRIHPVALGQLANLPPGVRDRLEERIDQLPQAPRPQGCKPLHGRLSGLWRIRVGDWRIAYEVDDLSKMVTVWSVGHRRDFYERLTRRL